MACKQHFLIAGGTRGIGKVLVEQLAGEGHAVSVLSRTAHDPVSCHNISYFQADVTNAQGLPAICRDIVESNGKFDHLVCMQRYRGDKEHCWDGEFAVTVTANKLLIEIFSGSCTLTGNNTVVIANSIASSHVIDTQPLGYHTAKAAIDQMIRYYAVMLGPSGIRVNGISPATILKPESEQYILDNSSLVRLLKEITPLRRIGTSVEVVKVIKFLTSAGSSFITGQTLIIDGGLSLQWQESLALRVYNGTLETV